MWEKKGEKKKKMAIMKFKPTIYLSSWSKVALSTNWATEDGSMNAVLRILYGPNLILGGFGSYMF